MTDKQRYNLLNRFINNTSVAKGGNIEIFVNSYNTSMKSKNEFKGMKWEDCELLRQMLMGATNFLFWCERNGYKAIKKKKSK